MLFWLGKVQIPIGKLSFPVEPRAMPLVPEGPEPWFENLYFGLRGPMEPGHQ